MITINAVLFGVLATLFVEMALVIIVEVIKRRVRMGNKCKSIRKTEVR